MVHAIDRYGRSRAREAAFESRLREAQLDLLRAQLRPHFLFNALNTISELVHEDPERADAMLGHLSALLRASIDAGDRQIAPLDEEIQLVEHYLAIQRVRFGDRLTVHLDVPEDCRLASVPHLVLQPLVENAIVHGISPRAEGGTVWITASRHAGAVVVKVEDDGVGLPPSRAAAGVGLANTRARLAAMYGDRASLDVATRPGGGVLVTLTVEDRAPSTGQAAVRLETFHES
jgi:LytS/YehU family sensor histidine kinase